MSDLEFPLNYQCAHLCYPVGASESDVLAAHQAWFDEIVTAEGANGFLRTVRPDTPDGVRNSTVSEGISYGMMISLMVGDQDSFDAFFGYADHWSNENGLMCWYIAPDGSRALGTGGATDADEDIAWALSLAAQKWGGRGSLGTSYEGLAKRQIDRIYRFEVDHDRFPYMLLPGDEWRGQNVFNPSYFAPYQYRIFGELTGEKGWDNVVERGYEILEACLNTRNGNAENGLVPAWCDCDGNPVEAFPGAERNYQTDAARTPFRMVLDYALCRDERARRYLNRVSKFFAQCGAENVIDGYDLDGAELPDRKTKNHAPGSAVFVGCAAAAAMHDREFQTFLDAAYERVRSGKLLARSRYYNHCWTVLSLLLLTGNFPPSFEWVSRGQQSA